MKRWKVCNKKPKLDRRVSCNGIVFCSDKCYDQYDDSLNDFEHPYVNDYDAVSFEYMVWMRGYENQLFEGFYSAILKRRSLLRT